MVHARCSLIDTSLLLYTKIRAKPESRAWFYYISPMACDEARCVGCGDSVPPGQRKILANDNRLLMIWREVFREKLEELNLRINERLLLGLDGDSGSKAKGFLCRKCKRGFESYHSSKQRLLDNASNAVKHFDTLSPRGQRRPREEDEDLTMNHPPPKRPFQPTSSHSQVSPDVQVRDNTDLIITHLLR